MKVSIVNSLYSTRQVVKLLVRMPLPVGVGKKIYADVGGTAPIASFPSQIIDPIVEVAR